MKCRPPRRLPIPALLLALWPPAAGAAEPVVREVKDGLEIETDQLSAKVNAKGYVSGVAAGTFRDKKTGAREVGFGLHIMDFLLAPGWRDDGYLRDPKLHGNLPKHYVEGPQICTQAKELSPRVIKGKDFVAIEQSFNYKTAAPNKKTGSKWTQRIVFPEGKRYFVSSDRIDAVNDSPAMFLRIDMPGHIKHKGGDTFSEVYLSYHGSVPSKEFAKDFAPDEKFLYTREAGKEPKRFIRAYRTRDPKTGKDGPWLAGMTLDPAAVYEAWCHQRGYVCLIEEIGGRPVKAGESFGAAFVVGFFDSVEEMNRVYDEYAGHNGLEVTAKGWKLTRTP
jgi:hypothetical protein